jgi:hypothetical protein
MKQWTPNGMIDLSDNHPLMLMTDEEFAKAVDDPFWILFGEVMDAATRRTATDFQSATDNAGDSADARGSTEADFRSETGYDSGIKA